MPIDQVFKIRIPTKGEIDHTARFQFIITTPRRCTQLTVLNFPDVYTVFQIAYNNGYRLFTSPIINKNKKKKNRRTNNFEKKNKKKFFISKWRL